MRKYHLFIIVITFIILCFFSQNSFANVQDNTKVINIYFNITNNTFYEIGKEIIYNHPSNYGLQQEYFKVQILSDSDEVIDSFGIWDPRISIGDDILYNENGSLGPLTSKVVYEDNINFTITIPFYKNAQTLNIFDSKTNEQLISINLTGLILDFCIKNCDDPNCNSCSKSIFSLFEILIIIFISLIAIIVLIIIRKK